MYDPSMRVLTVLELLQEREQVTGSELARRLEVSPRTVQRYVARLQDLGIPVEGKRGVGGAYRLRPGFRLPPLMFSGEEALSLALGLKALQHLGLTALTPAAHSAGAKLRRTLPHALRQEMEAIEEAVQLDTEAWTVSTDAALLVTLLRAVRHAKAAQFAYRSRLNVDSLRTVDIYRVAQFGGSWYAVGRCHSREALRCFRLDRMSALTVLDASFVPPGDFDVLGHLRATWPDTPESHHIDVWLGLPSSTLRGRVSTWGVTLTEENGGTRVQAQREHLEAFAAMLLGLCCEVRIAAPAQLHDTFGTLAERCRALAEVGG
ncbi:YafY family transcriptional regulator [Deinococcus psychrotolerans]|uniref:YafY family transcriptional regulator n=1 Tax=Deinococcus psychrotolerans TaxID=2489213 RepID=A0A3G8YMP4_9DEIO|nr:YafY family protein [Deinococcus psychrotolerans]AZI42841.1 YafY family transcriptional regulator [Deinococcus psychrotolerans]